MCKNSLIVSNTYHVSQMIVLSILFSFLFIELLKENKVIPLLRFHLLNIILRDNDPTSVLLPEIISENLLPGRHICISCKVSFVQTFVSSGMGAITLMCYRRHSLFTLDGRISVCSALLCLSRFTLLTVACKQMSYALVYWTELCGGRRGQKKTKTYCMIDLTGIFALICPLSYVKLCY